MSQHHKLLIGFALGATLGTLASLILGPGSPVLQPFIHYVSEPLGQIFIRLLLMLVVPIIFSALVVGLAELDLSQMGRLGARTLAYTVIISTLAVLLGLGLTNLFQPGSGVSPELREQASSIVQAVAAPASTDAIDLIVAIVPSNPLQAASTGDMIGFICFSALFGVALALTKTEAANKLKDVIAGLFDVCMRLIELVLRMAPLGVGMLLFTMTARMGFAVLLDLGAYVGIVLLGLGLHMFGVYSLSVRFFGGLSPWHFFRSIRLAILTAFSTASSNATLPTALRVADENLHLPRHISRFVLTAGATMNQNGTALFEGVTVLFLAQVHGVELALTQQVVVMVVCVLAGIGTAGVPAGSLPVIAMILGTLGVPPESIGLIVGVDRLLDMCRTTVNVAGDLAAAVYVTRAEGLMPPQRTT